MLRLVAGCCLLVLCSTALIPPTDSKPLFVSHFENVLGTSLELKVKAASEADAHKAETAALNEIERLAGILSAYDPNSEFSRWAQTYNTPVPVSPDLFAILNQYDQWRVRTNGALDASAEVVSRLWKQAAKRQTVPTEAESLAAIATVNETHWKLDPANRTATHLSHAPLMLNSFTKSYIVDKACAAALVVPHVSAAVVNIGGDLVVKGDLTEKIDVTNPRASADNDTPMTRILASNKAIATSGNYRRGVEINGHWYSHIVDPRTAEPVENIIGATVVSSDAVVAGALATAFNVLTPSESQQLAASLPDVEYLIITKDGQQLTSNGWKALTTLRPERASDDMIADASNRLMAPTDKKWNTDYELAINLEVAKLEGRVRRPFVAIWVEDDAKKPVRNLAVWFNKPKWLRDLRSWYTTNYQRSTAGEFDLASVSSATRSPGQYTLKWDGKDDKGDYVKKGKYTIFIEAAREHGTYQLIEQTIDVSKNKDQQITLTGNVEITSASLEYRKKTDK